MQNRKIIGITSTVLSLLFSNYGVDANTLDDQKSVSYIRQNDYTNPQTLLNLSKSSLIEGSAKGQGYSGLYEAKAGKGRFVGSGCSADFVLAYDLAINMGLPKDTIKKIVKKGHPKGDIGEMNLKQNDGFLSTLEIGDDIDVNGWINHNGDFLLAQTCEAMGNHGFGNETMGCGFIIKGKVQGNTIKGEYIEYVYNFGDDIKGPKGLCANVTPFKGEK